MTRNALIKRSEPSDLRQVLYHLVDAVAPGDALEAQHIAQVLGWAESVSASDVAPDLMALYGLLVRGPQMLLTQVPETGLWTPFLCHTTAEEHPTETLERTFSKAAGVAVRCTSQEPLFLTVSKVEEGPIGKTNMVLWYVLTSRHAERIHERMQTPALQLRWVSQTDLASLPIDPHMMRFLEKINIGDSS